LIDGCDLVFLAKSKNGDYHQEMNSVVFLEWFENQLMPALKRTCMQNNQTFAFTRGYFWDIRPIIRKPHIICAVMLVNPCFIHVHDIIPCFPKRFFIDLVFLAKSKNGDYHQEMNSVVFLEWFENQLMPALKNPSLFVLDNASYHNVKTEDTVCPINSIGLSSVSNGGS
jgi:transposase